MELSPYINGIRNLIEKQLVYNRKFPTPLSLRKDRDFYTNIEVCLSSEFNKLWPIINNNDNNIQLQGLFNLIIFLQYNFFILFVNLFNE